jgi:hypothetical protein
MRLQQIILGLVVIFSISCRSQKLKKARVEVGPSITTTAGQDSVEAPEKEIVNIKEVPGEPKVFFDVAETTFETAKLKTQIDVRSSQLNQAFPANINIKKDSVIWISVVVGLEAARATINRDSVFLLDRLNRKYYKLSFADLSRQLNFDLNFGLLQSLILGNMPVRPDSTDIYKKETSFNTIAQKRNEVSIDNKFDSSNNQLFEIEANDQKSKSQMSIKYKEFVSVSEKILPQIISVIVNGGGEQPKNTTITFQHSKFDFSDKELKFPFSIPKSYSEGKIKF